MKKSIAIIDCAVKDPAISCFNRLQREINSLLSYHNFPAQGLRSLNLEEGFSGIIILGSHSNVGDGSTWHSPLKEFILTELSKGTPVFGICFGHQLMAHAFGSELDKSSDKKTLEGLRTINLSEDIFNIEAKNISLFTAHNYQISKLAPELRIIGSSSDSSYELIAHKTLPYWSCQSHPEGSDFFLENEISFSLDEEKRMMGLRDGLLLLKSFISEQCS